MLAFRSTIHRIQTTYLFLSNIDIFRYYLEDPTGLFRLERSEKQAYEVDKGASNPAGLAGEAIKV